VRDLLLTLVKNYQNPVERLNVSREYLQASVLRSLHTTGAFKNLSFVGGTALRFLYGLPRFSEDLDFSLENSNQYQPEDWLKKVKRDLEFEGFMPTISWNDKKTVHTAWIKLDSLLNEIGVSPLPTQKIAIKLEIDSEPPPGASMTTSMINRHQLFVLRHHDLPSLMAGKIRALLTRSFTKGRDWYDLMWYRSRVPPVEPNLLFLARSLKQKPAIDIDISFQSWRSELRKKLVSLNWEDVVKDIEPFLEHRQDLEFFKQEFVDHLLE